jgi:hypothetical protein
MLIQLKDILKSKHKKYFPESIVVKVFAEQVEHYITLAKELRFEPMKILLLSVFITLTFSPFTAYSQLTEKIEKEKVVPGYIIKNGKEIRGYIKETGTAYTRGKFFPAPWQFQSDIKFIPRDVFETTEKITNKLFEKYGPKEIEGYKYESMVYESVNYTPFSDIGLSDIPRMIFLRKINNEKITLYHLFDSPPNVVSGPEGFEPVYLECAVPSLVYLKEKGGNVKKVIFLNIEKELADCPFVTEKQKKGEYKVMGKEEEASGLNKLINNTMYREKVRLMAIEDYNKNCK